MIAETSEPCIVIGDSVFLYSVIRWTVKRDSRMRKDAFIATNFVLVPITSLSQGPGSRVSGSQGPRSRVPGPGSQVLILDYAVLSAEILNEMLL